MSEKATVERVIESHADGILIIHIKRGEKTQVYRVREEEYIEAGEPREGDELDAEALSALTLREDSKRAYERALKILASGDNTRAALKRKLRERGFGEAESEYAVGRVCADGYIKEEEMLLRQFAVFAKRMWGPAKFIPSLLSRGFSREMIEQAAKRAAKEEIYWAEAVKEALLEKFEPRDDAERRALLYKYGFRP